MKVKLKDIAMKVDVSATTVSLVLNDKPCRVSSVKRAEIKRVAEELNYQPNMFARRLATKESRIIGLIIPDLENPFFATLANEISKYFYEKNYFTIIESSNDDFKHELDLINELVNLGVDGVLIALSDESYNNQEAMNSHFQKMQTPYVLLDRSNKLLQCNQVYFDNVHGGYLAAKYLIEQGHKDIGFLRAPAFIENANDRYLGYIQALEEHNLEVKKSYIAEGDYRALNSSAGARQLLAQEQLTAIITANDLMAFSVFKCAYEMDIKIPEEISLVGYDNSKITQMYPIQLTTINQNVADLSLKASELLKQMITEGTKEEQIKNIKLAPNLVIGSTTMSKILKQ